MDLIDKLKNISQNIAKLKDAIQTEEATKTAFVLPFISALGYEIFDPTEVIPEYNADLGTKKGEKVDYAIMKDGSPIMFFECKKIGCELDIAHASQLYRYFATTSKTRIGILTNGINYHFFSDLDEPNMMDAKPFLEINMMDLQENAVTELKKLSKASFNIDDILSAASDLKYMKETKRLLAEQLINPKEEFIKFFATEIYKGVKTQKVLQTFSDIVRRAFNQFINDKINERLKSAMAGEVEIAETEAIADEPQAQKTIIETTPEEMESFYIVKAILHDVIDSNRLFMKDFKGFCNVVLDDNNTKTIIRFYYNNNNKQISLFDDAKKETKYPIDTIEAIYTFKEQIISSVHRILAPKETNETLN